ncbi:MAG: 1,4-alpha-glucan branching protein GlgB [Bacillales bacterium]|jgi:1,4-alpha-glucan branching enzyme|nr:1,4-alpha-glucan branching protein GlgB [Bacillales bacterium]
MDKFDIVAFFAGTSTNAYNYFGAHKITLNGQNGVVFRVFAPNAKNVQLIGNFNNWDGGRHYMYREDSGIFSIFVPNISDYEGYKYKIETQQNTFLDKCDPYAFFSEYRPQTASKVFDLEGFPWLDSDYLKSRNKGFNHPVSIYEVHLGSWQRKPNNDFNSYEELAQSLIPYVKEKGFTHIELLPILEHPFDGSWGYLCTGYFNATSRYGNPKQLMHFIDKCHQNNIGVILDFVPVHFVKDDFGLRQFDGSQLYESGDSQWGSSLFDLGKETVRSFLISSGCFWLDKFHFDGIRVDAVSNIIYYHGNPQNGINYGGLDFIKRFNHYLALNYPTAMLIAEDSSSFSAVTKATIDGGLGFDYKWDLGWMNDTLKYFKLDPIYRKFHHHQLTFSMMYFYSERFLLPLSHDEVVHLKGSIINKMWGNYEDKFSQAKLLYAYMFAHPGKKLNFMGNEFASFDEWNEGRELPWSLNSFPKHQGFERLFRDLNLTYKSQIALYRDDYNPDSFFWIEANNADQSIYIFVRVVADSRLICLFNMTPIHYENYNIGVPWAGSYKEIINTQKEVYGGYGGWNGELLQTFDSYQHQQRQALSLRISAFSGIILAWVPGIKKRGK